MMKGERGQPDETTNALKLLKRKIEEQNEKLEKLQSKRKIVIL